MSQFHRFHPFWASLPQNFELVRHQIHLAPFADVCPSQLEEARTYLEQMIFARVYYEAMFLNDYEADKQRDEWVPWVGVSSVLRKHCNYSVKSQNTGVIVVKLIVLHVVNLRARTNTWGLILNMFADALIRPYNSDIILKRFIPFLKFLDINIISLFWVIYRQISWSNSNEIWICYFDSNFKRRWYWKSYFRNRYR